MGFELNEAKTHFISNADRQTVTGLVVNEKLSIPSSYKRNLRQEIYYTLKFGIEDSIVHGNRLNFLEDGQPIRCPTYMTHLIGSVQYVLQIEPENRWFLNAKQKLLDYARAYFRDEGLGEEYYLHRSRLREKMNEMQGGDLGLQDRIQIYNASYSHYQPCHAAAEIFSSKL